MPERDGYIAGVPCWVEASEPDPDAAVDFYGGLFGWVFEDVTLPRSESKYFIARGEARSSSIFDTSGEVRSGDVAAVRSIPEGAPPAAMWNTYFWVDSADEAASKVLDAGGGITVEPFDFMKACRMAVFADPEGTAFSVWEATRTSSRASFRSGTTSPTRRRTGASRSPPTTPTPWPRRPRSSAATYLSRRSMPRGPRRPTPSG